MYVCILRSDIYIGDMIVAILSISMILSARKRRFVFRAARERERKSNGQFHPSSGASFYTCTEFDSCSSIYDLLSNERLRKNSILRGTVCDKKFWVGNENLIFFGVIISLFVEQF